MQLMQESWRSLLNGMLEAVCLVEPATLQILQVNHACEILYGKSAAKIVGQSIKEWIDTPEDVFFWDGVAQGHHDNIESETLLRRANGELRYVLRKVSQLAIDDQAFVYVIAYQDCTGERAVEKELEQIIGELRATLESTVDGILVTDHQNAIRGYNQKFSQLFQLPQHLLVRRNDDAVYAWVSNMAEDAASYRRHWQTLQSSNQLEVREQLRLKNGTVLECVALPQFARGESIGRVYSFRDITERLLLEREMHIATRVFNHAPEGIFVADAGFVVRAANPAFNQLTLCESSGTLLLDDLFTCDDSREALLQWRKTVKNREQWQGELWVRQSTGNAIPCHVSMVKLDANEDSAEHYVGFIQDMTDAVAAKKRIEELAYQDALTGLPNRVTLNERFQFVLQQSQRNQGQFAVLFMDLDRFKNINDSLGHAFGDTLLKTVAERLMTCVRQVDMVARLGGDEFVLLLSDTHQRGAEITARRILDALGHVIHIGELSVNVSTSIGIALFPEDGDSMDELIKNADSAMYSVKERGRDDFRFYQKEMNIGLLSKVKLDTAIRQAIERESFSVHYQPLICINSKKIVGAEALLRWRHADMGNVSPAQFIPVAEESGSIVPLGKWVLKQACLQGVQWKDLGFNVVMSVNVSVSQFHQSSFIDTVLSTLAETGLPPELLELELTESMLVNDVEEAITKLSILNAKGVRVSIDDFGTGYSSFMYLKRFPVQKLKIDRSFIRLVPHNAIDTAIVSAIISMSKSLGLAVVAEGVETVEQRDYLSQLNCEQLQGFWFSPAVEASAFERLLAHQ